MDSMKKNNEQYNYSIKELRELCQPSAAHRSTETFAGRSARKFSIYFTKYFLKTSVTPNQITVVGTGIYLFGTFLYIFHNYALSLFGFLLLYIATILDASDGEVFRARKYRSGYGTTYVEPLSHDIMYALMFLPMSYGVFLATGNYIYLIFGFSAPVFKLLFRLTEHRFFCGVSKLLGGLGHKDDTKKFKEQSKASKLIYVLYRNICTSTGMLIPLLIATLANRVGLFLIFYGTAYFVLWSALFVRQMIRFRKISKQLIARYNYFQQVRGRVKDKKIIIFDLDGTLLDNMSIFADIASYLIAWRYEIPRAQAKEMYIKTSGLPFFKQLEIIFTGHQFNKEVSGLYEKRKIHATDHLEIAPEDKEVLRKLTANGYKIAISSNNFQENIDRFVKFSDIDFHYALGYRDGFEKGKDHFDYIRKKEKINRKEMIFVADSIYDMKKANAYQIDFIAKAGTFFQEDFERESNNVIVIKKLEELNSILRK